MFLFSACLPTDTDLGQRTTPTPNTQNQADRVILMTTWGGINCQGVLTVSILCVCLHV